MDLLLHHFCIQVSQGWHMRYGRFIRGPGNNLFCTFFFESTSKCFQTISHHPATKHKSWRSLTNNKKNLQKIHVKARKERDNIRKYLFVAAEMQKCINPIITVIAPSHLGCTLYFRGADIVQMQKNLGVSKGLTMKAWLGASEITAFW